MKAENMMQKWNKSLSLLSGNLTTNEYMPESIKNKLLDEDRSLCNKIEFNKIDFSNLGRGLDDVVGLNILSGLQKMKKKGCFTFFRAVRFPTYKRIYKMINEKGFCIENYEQERILNLYKDSDYLSRKFKIQEDKNFHIQSQERVVRGLPVFTLVNDALQIHRAFRLRRDKVVIVAVHIPYELIEDGCIKLVSNSAIDIDYDNFERDFEIKDFVCRDGFYEIDYHSLRLRGIDLYEMYLIGSPWDLGGCEKLGIIQDYFLLDIYDIRDEMEIERLLENSELLKKNESFLHGFFGDQSVFGRRRSNYLPFGCRRILKNENFS